MSGVSSAAMSSLAKYDATMIEPIRDAADVYLALSPYWSSRPRKYPERLAYDAQRALSAEAVALFSPVETVWASAQDNACPKACAKSLGACTQFGQAYSNWRAMRLVVEREQRPALQ